MSCARISLVVVVAAGCGSHHGRVQTAPPDDVTAAVSPPAPVAAPEPPATEPVAPPPGVVPFRWVRGLAAYAVSDQPSASAGERLGPPEDCRTGDTRAHVLTADVSPWVGIETVLVSTAHGVTVLDADGHRIGATSLGCGGSADEIVAVAAGTIDDVGPVIAVVATRGGRREARTRVELLRVDRDHDHGVESLFSATIETRDGDELGTGSIKLIPGGLVHRAPGRRAVTWTYDPATRAYVRTRWTAGVSL